MKRKIVALLMSIRGNRLFFRILLYFLTLLIPLAIVSAFFYMNYIAMMKEEISSKITQNVQSSSKTVDLYLRTTHETSLNLLQSDLIQTLLKPNELYTLEERTELGRIPRNISRASSILSEFTDYMFVYVDTDKIYTGSGVENFESFFTTIYQFEAYPLEFWEHQLASKKNFEILAPTTVTSLGRNKGEQIPFITRTFVNGFDAITVTTIPVKAITETFTNNAIFSATEFVILDDQEKLMAGDRGGLEPINELLQKHNPFGGMVAGSFEGKISKERSLLNYVNSNNYGWKYYSVTPMTGLSQITKGIILFIIICILSLGAGILFSVIFSIKIYNPIKKIRDILEEQSDSVDDVEMDSSYNNQFEYIGQGVARLNENKKVLKSSFNKVNMEYLDYMLLNLLKGNRVEQEETTMLRVLKDKVGFMHSNYLCCNIQLQFNSTFYEQFQDIERLNIISKLKKLMSGLMRDYVESYVLEYGEYLYVCVVNLQETDNKTELKRALNQLIHTFQFDFDYCNIYVGIGKPYPRLNNIASSFSDAMTALESKEIGKQFQIIDSAAISIENNFYYSFVDENKLINGLKVGDAEQLQKMIHDIIQTNRDKGVSHHYMGMLFYELFNTGYKYIVEKGIYISDIISEEKQHILRDQSYSSTTKDEKIQLLIMFYQEIVRQTTQSNEYKTSVLVSSIMNYIDQNYQHDLYLEKISEQTGVSSKYVSRIFKEKTGMNLTDYIGLVRISAAKEMLRDTNLSVNDIAERVGFFSRSTFLRNFRKLEGLSPIEFRNMSKMNREQAWKGGDYDK